MLEPIYDVCPDVDGLYTDFKVTKAQPTTSDFDPSEVCTMFCLTFFNQLLCFFLQSLIIVIQIAAPSQYSSLGIH